MPSPFPGMDPYLEAREQWPIMHTALIYCCFAALNRVLPPEYLARIEECLYVLEPPRTVVADLALVRRPESSNIAAVLEPADTTTETDAPMLLRASRSPIRERYIDVVAVGTPGRVITTIEILSPANKRPGAGREEYLCKQQAILDSDTHLLEIDLLREGVYTLAAPESEMLLQYGPWHYAVSLHRAGQENLFEAWARTVRERLPRVRVPLTSERGDILLDLQAVFDRAYDEGRFGAAVDYQAEPIPPLSSEDAAWSDTLLRQQGVRR